MGNSTASDDIDCSQSESQESGRESKHKKKKKKKHKKKKRTTNPIEDPMDKVFYSLTLGLENLAISNATSPRVLRAETSKNHLPSIFQSFNYIGQLIGQLHKPLTKRGRPKKNPTEFRGSEQRLPLKKRYHEVNKDQSTEQVEKPFQKAREGARRSPCDGRRKVLKLSAENMCESKPAAYPPGDSNLQPTDSGSHFKNDAPRGPNPLNKELKIQKDILDQNLANKNVNIENSNKSSSISTKDKNILEERRKKNEKDLESRFDEILLNANSARLRPVDHVKISQNLTSDLAYPLINSPKSETPPPPVLEPIGKDGDLLSSSEWDEPPILEMEVGTEDSCDIPSLYQEGEEKGMITTQNQSAEVATVRISANIDNAIEICSYGESTNEIIIPEQKRKRGRISKSTVCKVENSNTEVVAIVSNQNSTFEVTVTVEDASEIDHIESVEEDRAAGRPKRHCVQKVKKISQANKSLIVSPPTLVNIPKESSPITENIIATPDGNFEDFDKLQNLNSSSKEDSISKEQDVKAKKRKRKANRTGFPSVKKKKRFSLDRVNGQVDSDRSIQTPDSEAMSTSSQPIIQGNPNCSSPSMTFGELARWFFDLSFKNDISCDSSSFFLSLTINVKMKF